MLVNSHALTVMSAGVLEAAGLRQSDAQAVAEQLVRADSRGTSSHGVIRLGIYCQRIEKGHVNPDPDFRILSQSPSVAVLDADGAMGQIAGTAAMDRAINLAGEFGSGVVAVRNSSHFGQAGHYAEIAANSQSIGIAFCNSAARMPAWGARTPTFGTNPIAIAAPTPDEFNIVLDMATSASTLGRIVGLANQGATLAPGMALNREGRETLDPQEALKGVLLPIAGPKGAGLALMIDILAGVLSGGAFGRNVRSLYRDEEPEGIGNLFIALDISSFLPVTDYLARVSELISQIRNSELAHGFEEIVLPGEREHRLEVFASENGIHLEESTALSLEELVHHYGIEWSPQ